MRRGVRAPFVITVAVSTIACSSGSSSNPPGIHPIDSGEPAPDIGSEGEAQIDADANPAECPVADPGIGARLACSAPSSVLCTYPDLCPSAPTPGATNVYACKNDDGTGAHWTLVSPAYVPPCPATAPSDGDRCPCTVHLGYAACNYGVCSTEGAGIVYAACKGVDTFDPVWHVKSIACNPPEPDAAPDSDADADAAEISGETASSD